MDYDEPPDDDDDATIWVGFGWVQYVSVDFTIFTVFTWLGTKQNQKELLSQKKI